MAVSSIADDNRRLRFSIRVLALALLSGILISWQLWLTGREFPLSPILPLPELPGIATVVLFGIFCFSIALLFIFPDKRWIVQVVFCIALFEAVTDQNRWQPWFYQYVLMLFLLLFRKTDKDRSGNSALFLDAFRLIICGIYFWSGVQKFNPEFFKETASWLTEPLADYFGKGFAQAAGKAAWLIPGLEIFLAFGLMAGAARKYAVVIAICMHTYIAVLTTPLGRDVNYVILPWNLSMIAFLILLFSGAKGVSVSSVFNGARTRFVAPVFLLVWLLPWLSCFGYWPSYLSASLYSGNSDDAYIYFEKQQVNLLPAAWKEKVYTQIPQTKPDTLYYIYVNECSMKELKVPAYPETALFKAVKAHVEDYLPEGETTTLVIYRKWTWASKRFYENVQ